MIIYTYDNLTMFGKLNQVVIFVWMMIIDLSVIQYLDRMI